MLKMYKTDMQTNEFKKVETFERGIWINLVNPSEKEIQKVCTNLGINEEFIRYPLDFEEKARIDTDDDDTKLFIIDVPIVEENEGERVYTTMPLGMIVVRDDYFITVSLNSNAVVEQFEKGKVKTFYTYKKTRFILQILYLNASYYLNALKQINRKSENIVKGLQKSIKNKELIQLLNIENSLVYIATSLRSNEVVMEKTLTGKVVKLYDEDEDILEDAIVENKQAIEMSKIYSDILSGTMDASASIISNNLNDIMKFLSSITIVLSLPTMIFSFWGMNVKLPFAQDPMGALIVLGIAVLLAMVSFVFLKRRDML